MKRASTALVNTSALTPAVDQELNNYLDYANQYHLFTKQTAEAVLRTTMVLVAAYKKLSPEEHNRFCDEVGLEPDDSKYKKLYRIGEAATRLLPYVDALPNAWTTMYLLARLEAEHLDLLIKQGQLSSMMTAKEIEQVVGKKKELKPRLTRNVITIKFKAHVAPEQVEQVLQALEGLKENIPFQIEREPDL